MKTEIYWKVAELLAASVRDGVADTERLKEVRLSLLMELDKEKVHGWSTVDTERLLRLTDGLPTSDHFRGITKMVMPTCHHFADVSKMEITTTEGGQL